MRDPFDHPTFDDLEPEGDIEDAFEGDAFGEDTPYDLPLSGIEDDLEDNPDNEAQLEAPELSRVQVKPSRRSPKRRKKVPVSAQARPDATRVRRERADWFDDEYEADEDDAGEDFFSEDGLDVYDLFDADLETTPTAPRDLRAAGLKEDAALLKALSRQLAHSRNAAEVAGLVGAMVSVALRTHPHVYGGLWQLAPDLVTEVTRAALRQPRLTRTLPTSLERVVARLAQYVERGRKPTPTHIKRLVGLELSAQTNPKGRHPRRRR